MITAEEELNCEVDTTARALKNTQNKAFLKVFCFVQGSELVSVC